MRRPFARFFARPEPMLSEAGPRDAATLATLHGASFRRGWSENEFERLLLDRSVLAHRATLGGRPVGFIISRIAAGETEILSVAVARAHWRAGFSICIYVGLPGLAYARSFSKSTTTTCRHGVFMTVARSARWAGARVIIHGRGLRPRRPWCCAAISGERGRFRLRTLFVMMGKWPNREQTSRRCAPPKACG
jgi:hypothetical protein